MTQRRTAGRVATGAYAPGARVCGRSRASRPGGAGQRVSWARSAEPLGQADDDALRAAHEAEPVDVLVLRDLADEFGAVGAQAGHDVVDVVYREHDAAY